MLAACKTLAKRKRANHKSRQGSSDASATQWKQIERAVSSLQKITKPRVACGLTLAQRIIVHY